jgi:hypothetical protein
MDVVTYPRAVGRWVVCAVDRDRLVALGGAQHQWNEVRLWLVGFAVALGGARRIEVA